MLRLILTAAAAVTALSFAASDAVPKADTPGPLLAELFTSQGCSSCPPAERFFASLAGDPDYVTIEWHVDYWDDLVHGGARWKDPFSSPEFTERQRAYNAALRGTRAVYTPQAVLSGSREFVGSRPAELAFARPIAAAPMAQLEVSGRELTASGDGEGEVWFVRLLAEQKTDVTAGENKGHVLAGKNIAIGMQSLGPWAGGEATYAIPRLKAGEACALFIQSEAADGGPGPVLAATYCDGG
jgi:hypothetical protein